LTAADVRIGLVDFLAVCEVLLDILHLRHFTCWKSSSWAIDSTEVLFTTPLRPSCALAFRMAFYSFDVTVCMLIRTLKSGFPFVPFQKFALILAALFTI
jgi:hypothetical protein